MGKKYLLTIAISDYRLSIENVEFSSPVQHNASPDKNSRTTVMVSFLDVTGIKPCPDLSPNQNALRIASSTEPTLIRKEDTTPLTVVQFLCSLHHCKRWHRWSTFNGRQQSGQRDDISVIPCSCRSRAATTNLSNSCTGDLERFSSARNDTFVDSELCSYTGDGTPLLQLSDHSSTCEVVQGKDRIRASVLVEDPTTLAGEIPGSPEVQTAYDCLRHGLQVSGDGPCIGSRKPGNDKYEFIKYSEAISKAQCIGSGIIQLGLKPRNDTFVGAFALNSEECCVSFMRKGGSCGNCMYCVYSELVIGIATMGKLPDLDAFDRGQIVGARRMGIQFTKSSDS
ncbi:long-chain-fatty-acid--CoA ligase 1 [Trichonephila clavipes]|nr:long-chain-fatty-acid--CoA ligase 1 [Trichonephila clavipes]